MIAAAAMAASSLSVVGNANRLRRWHPRPLHQTNARPIEPSVETAHRDMATEVIDPVRGMAVDPATAAGAVELDGQRYAFCSADCQSEFTTEPGRYLLSSAR